MTRTITVRIDERKFWDLAKHHDVHMNVSVFKRLRDEGIPVDGGLDLRGVTRGRLTMWNEETPDGRICVYQWQDVPPVRVLIDMSDEEL